MPYHGVNGDAITFTSFLEACAKAREINYAECVFQLMQEREIQPNIFTYTSLARAYANCGKWQEAELLSDSMERAGLPINDFFLYALLLAYATARPTQSNRAEATFLRVIRLGHVQVNRHLETVLCRAIGRSRAKTILAHSQCMVNSSTIKECHEHLAKLGGIEVLVNQLDYAELDVNTPHDHDLLLEAVWNLEDLIVDQDGRPLDRFCRLAVEAGVFEKLQNLRQAGSSRAASI
eukprot:symbB.v1.2.019038.t1/scaffold1537.1/size118942/3